MEMTSVDIAILGGGLGGLALAAGLRHRGFDAHVFEGAEVLRRETSTLVGLGLNAFYALDQLHPELAADVRSRGQPTLDISGQARVPGREPETRTLPSTGLLAIRWSEVHASLASFVPPEAVHCGYQAEGFEEVWEEQQEGDGHIGAEQPPNGQHEQHDGESSWRGPASSVVIRFRDRPPVTARLAVGADGVFSAMRAAMFPTDPGPRYLGHMNWNCLLHNPGGNTVVDAHAKGQMKSITDRPTQEPFNTSVYVIDAGGGYTFWQVRMAYPEGPSFTCDLPERKDQQLQNGPHEEQLQQNLPNGEGVAEAGGPNDGTASAAPAAAGTGDADGDTARGGWRKGRGGLGVPGSKARVLERIQSLGWDDIAAIIRATPETSIFERALYDRLPLSRWSSPGGRLLLLGDAAHAMHPGPGQGARSAFEDAHALAEALGRCWPDVGAAGREYQEARVVRTARIQLHASTNSPVPAIRAAGRPVGLSEGDMVERFLHFHRWLEQYPAHPKGDPGSRWWAPLGPEGERELLSKGWGSGGKQRVIE